jgi:hypothetical protein
VHRNLKGTTHVESSSGGARQTFDCPARRPDLFGLGVLVRARRVG